MARSCIAWTLLSPPWLTVDAGSAEIHRRAETGLQSNGSRLRARLYTPRSSLASQHQCYNLEQMKLHTLMSQTAYMSTERACIKRATTLELRSWPQMPGVNTTPEVGHPTGVNRSRLADITIYIVEQSETIR